MAGQNDHRVERTRLCNGTVGEFKIVKGAADGKIEQATAATEQSVCGVAQVSGVATDNIRTVIFGMTTAIAGAALDSTNAADYNLMVDANGRLITWAGGAGTEYCVAQWVPSEAQPTAAADDQISVMFTGTIGHRA